MATISEALGIAVQYHQSGQFQAAEQLYRQVLVVDPNEANAWHLLGVLNAQLGRRQAAVDCLHRALALHPDWVDALYNLGRALFEQRRFDEAAACHRRAIELEPGYAEAHDNLGLVLQEQGKLDQAVACHRRALELRPDFAAAHVNLGNAWQAQGKLDEALACYGHALELHPNFAAAHSNLGNIWMKQGMLAEAVACYRRALELNPDYAEAHDNLGLLLRRQGKLDDAAACHRRAVDLRPDFVDAHNNLGNVYQSQGRLADAAACFRRALELKPDFAEAQNNLGNVYQRQGKLADAVACYRRALELKPDYPEAYSNLGATLRDQGNLDDAVACHRRALELKPDSAAAYNNLGNALKDQGKLDEAVACFGRALELKPDYATAYSNLGSALKEQGNLDEAVACYRRGLELDPADAAGHSNLLLTLQYRADVTLSELAAAHAEYDRRHARPLLVAGRPQEIAFDRTPAPAVARRLRVGFVSADFGRHPVGYFLVRCLENLDPDQCETVCYSDRTSQDDLTTRIQAAAAAWRDVIGENDEQLAEHIRADRIDILFDLAGHTAHNRLLVFARKPAPIQITWAGYVGTTGLSAMGYILADRYEIPPCGQVSPRLASDLGATGPQCEASYCERVLRMPDGYICYDPPHYAPPVSPLPAITNGHVTFAAFHNPGKITQQVVGVWAKVLRRLPQARLLFRFRGMDDRSVAGRLADLFAAGGIDRGRLEFLGFAPHRETLAEYGRVDIGLDTLPYNGGLTTCEALWMGVPVVTCPGETFAGRHSLSHLSNVGLTETVAGDLQQYVEIVVTLASDLPRLAALRAGLRQRMAASPLCDGKRFAANFAQVLRGVWRDWCGRDA